MVASIKLIYTNKMHNLLRYKVYVDLCRLTCDGTRALFYSFQAAALVAYFSWSQVTSHDLLDQILPKDSIITDLGVLCPDDRHMDIQLHQMLWEAQICRMSTACNY